MEFVETKLAGCFLVKPRVHRDERGFFLETFRASALAGAGIEVDLVQGNHSRSSKGILRGLHFQYDPGQPKLVRCARGSVWDVVVDIRPDSPTFGEWVGHTLDDEEHLQVYIPPGFAHGFCVMSDEADFIYQVGSYYDGDTEGGVAWDDPAIGIEWPIEAPVLSERDQNLPRLEAIRDRLPRL